MYAASRQFEEVPSILPEEVINHFTFDDGLLNRRADSYAELQKPDFDSAIVDARKRLVLIKNNLAVFRPGTVPELLSKREMRAKNNLAYYLAEAEQDLSDAVSLAKEALEAEPENISRADTYAYARLVRAVKDKSMTAPARSAEIVQAIRLFEDALSRARKSDKKELEQMLGLHLQQAKEVYEVSK